MKFPAIVSWIAISLLVLAGTSGTTYARDPDLLDGPSNNRFEGDPTGGVFGVLDGGTSGGGASFPPAVPPSEADGDAQPIDFGPTSDAAICASAMVPFGIFLTVEFAFFKYGVYR